ncbi:MAG: LTA synthase family protein [Eubacterium sp.]|nr:LTA synthase family protein [Eubacterium sp.]
MKNKRRVIVFLGINIVLLIGICLLFVYVFILQDSMTLTVTLGESHADERNIAQLFYTPEGEKFSSNAVLTEQFADDKIVFDISEIDFNKSVLRLDPFNMKNKFSITQIDISYGEKTVFTVSGSEIQSFIEKTKGVKCKYSEKGITCKSKKDDPRIYFSSDYSKEIYKRYFMINIFPYIISGVLLLILLIIEILLLKRKEEDGSKTWTFVISEVLVLVSIVCLYVVLFFEKNFGQVPFGQLLYHLHTPLDGTDISSYRYPILLGIGISIGGLILCLIIYIILKKFRYETGFSLWLTMAAIILTFYSCIRAVNHFEIVEYYKYTTEKTTLYEDRYVDGRDVSITFPEEKKNLIYIYLESIEVSYADAASGGGARQNYIPGLTKLAMENNCFSDGTALNGAHHVNGATYTMGALAAQTGGVPINENLVSNETLNRSWESENNYLPGLWTIGDILNEAGYNQEFLIGSNGNFAGRSSYFTGHGDYRIEDYEAAINEGRIPPDYKVWWGYEDEKLYEFAKEDLLRLSSDDRPFNFTLLTVDTHPTGGYVCDLCEDKYEAQYSNVIACADKQVSEFIEWIKQQEFYKDTVIVMCGDHLSPDSLYVNNEGFGGFDRRTYTNIINASEEVNSSSKPRVYTTLDMFPTTLAAMGVKIEGDRLGLGVNLYSDTPTLAEEYGLDYLNTELLKNSKFYKSKLLYK